MKKIIVIQDSSSKEYYFLYRIDEGFAEEFIDAYVFDSKEEAIDRIKDEYSSQFFEGRTIEIKEFYTIE